jgi:hypothetical protein
LTPVSPQAYKEMCAKRCPRDAWEKDLVAESRIIREGCGNAHSSETNASSTKTLMYLEQDVGPAAARKVPPMFRGILRRMCAATATEVFKVCTSFNGYEDQGASHTGDLLLHL